MLINVMDPALRIAGGHHLDIDKQIARELKRAGHDVQVYVHRAIEPDARNAMLQDAVVVPVFRTSPYMEPAEDVAADPLQVLTRRAATVAEDLGAVRAADLWIWPTLFVAQHHGCVLAATRARSIGCVMMEPTYLNPAGKMLWRHTCAAARAARIEFDLGVLEPTLFDEYRPLVGDGKLTTLPYPFDRVAAAARARPTLRKIGFFGNQRDEKGAALLGTLIDLLLQRDFEVVVHDSSGCSEGQDTQKLKLVLRFVEELPSEIAGCDLVVVPYRAEEYRYKGSGIVWSALANGVPVVAPAGSAPAKLVQAHRVGKLFNSFSAESVLDAILDAARDYRALSERSRALSDDWMQVHGVRNFVAALLDGRSNARPPRPDAA